MWRGAYRSGAAAMRAAWRACLVIVIAGCGLAGCTASGALDAANFGQPGFGQAGLRGTTVAFESIEGLPDGALFDKLKAQMNQQVHAHQLTAVSREATAQYRVKCYLGAVVQGKKTTFTWLWDVYSADQQLAVRLSGEVPGTTSEHGWAAADDQVVDRLAHDGMERLAAYLANPDAHSDVASR